jgi:hypothetical protein
VIAWASSRPAAGQVFDVQLMRAGGKWKTFRNGTRDPSGKITTQGKKVAISARARLRKASDATKATGWSPVKTVKG